MLEVFKAPFGPDVMEEFGNVGDSVRSMEKQNNNNKTYVLPGSMPCGQIH